MRSDPMPEFLFLNSAKPLVVTKTQQALTGNLPFICQNVVHGLHYSAGDLWNKAGHGTEAVEHDGYLQLLDLARIQKTKQQTPLISPSTINDGRAQKTKESATSKALSQYASNVQNSRHRVTTFTTAGSSGLGHSSSLSLTDRR